MQRQAGNGDLAIILRIIDDIEHLPVNCYCNKIKRIGVN